MTLLELGHVQADHAVLAAEHELGQRPHQLRLSHAGGAHEEEDADGVARVLQSGPGPAHRLGHGDHRFLLAHYPFVDILLHVEQSLCLLHGQPCHRYPGPHAYHLGHILFGDRRLFVLLVLAPLLFGVLQLLRQAHLPVPQLGGVLVLLIGYGIVLFLADVAQHLRRLFHRKRLAAVAEAHPRGGLVHHVDGLVGEEPVGNEPGG